ncbi:hypothetical protein MFLAVUS_004232 [Mucor flavus]|uniref:Uncharacterized protein n=1 Tax=Mucor flavus TaxID=439312 RepID=A0ABP9YVC0_9FUNG
MKTIDPDLSEGGAMTITCDSPRLIEENFIEFNTSENKKLPLKRLFNFDDETFLANVKWNAHFSYDGDQHIQKSHE